MEKSLLDKFIELHPDFSLDLEGLSKKSKEKFRRKLSREKQECNFLSTISEFRFCQFLENEGLEYEFEPKIEKKRPDFLIKTKNSETIYFDVKRFNTSELDSYNRRKLYEFCEKLKTIQRSFYVQVDQVSKNINLDIENAFVEAYGWILCDERKKDDILMINNELKIEIVKVDGIKPHVLYLFSGNNSNIHIAKPKTDVLTKLNNYKEEIIGKDIPFFVGIDLTFDTLITPCDYWLLFLGGSCMDSSTGTESFILGEFYNGRQLDYLTGLLIRYNNEFFWLKNPRNKTLIDFKNVKHDPKNN